MVKHIALLAYDGGIDHKFQRIVRNKNRYYLNIKNDALIGQAHNPFLTLNPVKIKSELHHMNW
jgi:hypothetical protein